MRIRALAVQLALAAALSGLPPVAAMAQSEPKPVAAPLAELPTIPAVGLQVPADIEDPETGGMRLPGTGGGLGIPQIPKHIIFLLFPQGLPGLGF